MNCASLVVCERRTSPVVYAPCGTHPQVSAKKQCPHIKPLSFYYKLLVTTLQHIKHPQSVYNIASTCFFLAISLRHSRSSCVCCSSLSLILLVSCCVNCIFFSFCRGRTESGMESEQLLCVHVHLQPFLPGSYWGTSWGGLFMGYH